jgi:hypothetical protein
MNAFSNLPVRDSDQLREMKVMSVKDGNVADARLHALAEAVRVT